jgi:hypothetical protein
VKSAKKPPDVVAAAPPISATAADAVQEEEMTRQRQFKKFDFTKTLYRSGLGEMPRAAGTQTTLG